MFLQLAQAPTPTVLKSAAARQTHQAGQNNGQPPADPAATAQTTEPFHFTDPASWQNLLMDYLPSIATVMVILIAAFVLSGVLGRLTTGALRRSRVDETIALFTGRLVRWGVMIIAVIICMAQFGVNTTSLAAMLAGIGFAVALAFQGTLSSFASGLCLMVLRPFKVGDTVRLNNEMAIVAEIDIFNTSLDTFDNRRIIMPNASVFGSTIENLTYHDTRRVDCMVRVGFDVDVDKTREVLHKAAKALSHRLEQPEHVVAITGIEEWSIAWAVRVWVKTTDFWPARDALAREVKVHLDEAGIGIATPRRDIHVTQSGAADR